MTRAGERLAEVVERAAPRLRALDVAARDARARPGAWSPRQLLGHLVDSASNNHQRFVRAAFQDDLVFPGYDQDAWVALQRYDATPWDELVELWRTFNLHLARLMADLPADAVARPRARHNLHVIGFGRFDPGAPVTLGVFLDDYVDHLEHHLAALRPPVAS